MMKLVILDYVIGDVDIYPIEYGYEISIEDTIKNLGHNIDNCEWMISQGNITFHKDILKVDL